jgi:hypothetical protein
VRAAAVNKSSLHLGFSCEEEEGEEEEEEEEKIARDSDDLLVRALYHNKLSTGLRGVHPMPRLATFRASHSFSPPSSRDQTDSLLTFPLVIELLFLWPDIARCLVWSSTL